MNRFRRLRTSEEIRRLVRETHVNIRRLIYPVFVAENISEKKPVESMPEVYQYPLSELDEIISRCAESRIG
ncbi:MAG: porphobilinogen synthase, partial [Ruminococcus sp.]|nr:porphobilinogen synthase [Ruminococcus sp.]